MKQILLVAALCVFAITGCNKDDTEATTAAEPAVAAAPTPATDAKAATEALPTDVISEVDHGGAPAGFDVKGFAGTFGGDDISLELRADGSCTLGGRALGGTDDAPASLDGTWTVEDGGKRIRIDPNDKGAQDWLFAVASRDALQAVDEDGKAPESGAGVLTRVE